MTAALATNDTPAAAELPLDEKVLQPAAGPDAWSEAVERLDEMGRGLIASIPNILIGIIVFALFYAAGKAIRAMVRRLALRRRKGRNLALVLGRLSEGFAFIIGMLVAAVIIFPNFTAASLIQLLGIGSVAVGFAFRDVLQNYLAGILLLLTEPFRIGDQIVFKEFEGTVEDIQTRATFIKTYDSRRVVIPNGELFTNAVLVNTAFNVRRLEYDLGIGYGDDIARAKKLILDVLKELEEVLDDPPPDVLAYDLAPSSVLLRIRWWIQPPLMRDVFDTRDRVIEGVKRVLVQNGIDLPFPTQQVLFHDQTEATDGDRRRQREGWPAGSGDVPESRKIADGIARVAEQTARRDGRSAVETSQRP